MSFPPTIGDTGDSPARGFVLGPDDGDAYWWLGSLTLTEVGRGRDPGRDGYRRSPSTTRIHPATTRTQRAGRGLLHHRGTIRGQLRRAALAGRARLARLPAQASATGFTVSDESPGRTLLINAPAGFADVITELGEPAADIALPGPDVPMPDPDRIAAVSQTHGIHNP